MTNSPRDLSVILITFVFLAHALNKIGEDGCSLGRFLDTGDCLISADQLYVVRRPIELLVDSIELQHIVRLEKGGSLFSEKNTVLQFTRAVPQSDDEEGCLLILGQDNTKIHHITIVSAVPHYANHVCVFYSDYASIQTRQWRKRDFATPGTEDAKNKRNFCLCSMCGMRMEVNPETHKVIRSLRNIAIHNVTFGTGSLRLGPNVLLYEAHVHFNQFLVGMPEFRHLRIYDHIDLSWNFYQELHDSCQVQEKINEMISPKHLSPADLGKVSLYPFFLTPEMNPEEAGPLVSGFTGRVYASIRDGVLREPFTREWRLRSPTPVFASIFSGGSRKDFMNKIESNSEKNPARFLYESVRDLSASTVPQELMQLGYIYPFEHNPLHLFARDPIKNDPKDEEYLSAFSSEYGGKVVPRENPGIMHFRPDSARLASKCSNMYIYGSTWDAFIGSKIKTREISRVSLLFSYGSVLFEDLSLKDVVIYLRSGTPYEGPLLERLHSIPFYDIQTRHIRGPASGMGIYSPLASGIDFRNVWFDHASVRIFPDPHYVFNMKVFDAYGIFEHVIFERNSTLVLGAPVRASKGFVFFNKFHAVPGEDARGPTAEDAAASLHFYFEGEFLSGTYGSLKLLSILGPAWFSHPLGSIEQGGIDFLNSDQVIANFLHTTTAADDVFSGFVTSSSGPGRITRGGALNMTLFYSGVEVDTSSGIACFVEQRDKIFYCFMKAPRSDHVLHIRFEEKIGGKDVAHFMQICAGSSVMILSDLYKRNEENEIMPVRRLLGTTINDKDELLDTRVCNISAHRITYETQVRGIPHNQSDLIFQFSRGDSFSSYHGHFDSCTVDRGPVGGGKLVSNRFFKELKPGHARAFSLDDCLFLLKRPGGVLNLKQSTEAIMNMVAIENSVLSDITVLYEGEQFIQLNQPIRIIHGMAGEVHLEGLRITNSSVIVEGGTLSLRNCVFENTPIFSGDHSEVGGGGRPPQEWSSRGGASAIKVVQSTLRYTKNFLSSENKEFMIEDCISGYNVHVEQTTFEDCPRGIHAMGGFLYVYASNFVHCSIAIHMDTAGKEGFSYMGKVPYLNRDPGLGDSPNNRELHFMQVLSSKFSAPSWELIGGYIKNQLSAAESPDVPKALALSISMREKRNHRQEQERKQQEKARIDFVKLQNDECVNLVRDARKRHPEGMKGLFEDIRKVVDLFMHDSENADGVGILVDVNPFLTHRIQVSGCEFGESQDLVVSRGCNIDINDCRFSDSHLSLDPLRSLSFSDEETPHKTRTVGVQTSGFICNIRAYQNDFCKGMRTSQVIQAAHQQNPFGVGFHSLLFENNNIAMQSQIRRGSDAYGTPTNLISRRNKNCAGYTIDIDDSFEAQQMLGYDRLIYSDFVDPASILPAGSSSSGGGESQRFSSRAQEQLKAAKTISFSYLQRKDFKLVSSDSEKEFERNQLGRIYFSYKNSNNLGLVGSLNHGTTHEPIYVCPPHSMPSPDKYSCIPCKALSHWTSNSVALFDRSCVYLSENDTLTDEAVVANLLTKDQSLKKLVVQNNNAMSSDGTPSERTHNALIIYAVFAIAMILLVMVVAFFVLGWLPRPSRFFTYDDDVSLSKKEDDYTAPPVPPPPQVHTRQPPPPPPEKAVSVPVSRVTRRTNIPNNHDWQLNLSGVMDE